MQFVGVSLRLIISITKGILRDRTVRRAVLFWLVMATLALVALGFWLLDDWLKAHPLLFLLYWGGCFWLTITFALLAVYDMLRVRQEEKK